jgi:hypothetical protein
MVTSVESGDNLRFERPRKLFDAPQDVDLTGYDVSADGQSFLSVQSMGESIPKTIVTIVQNWHDEFRNRE